MAVVPADSPLAERRTLDWHTLLSEDFITLQRPSMVRLMLEQRLRAEGIELPVAFESHQLITVGRMVAAGLGVSAMPSLCIGQMHELGARCLPLEAPTIQRAVGVFAANAEALSVAAQALREVIQETIAAPVLGSD